MLLLFQAKFVPQVDAFTRTVNAGDLGVEIAMKVLETPDDPGSAVQWRLNGGQPMKNQHNKTNYKIARPVSPADEGVYEIYYDDERESRRGALFRLIVRG